MDSSKKSIKITEIVRLQLIIKKWKKMAVSPKTPSPLPTAGKSNNTINSFLKRTLSFPDDSAVVPKGYLAVCVGTELRRFIIPTSYLRHRAFAALLHEAEEEFGFHQEGVLKIPCEVVVFERILKTVEGKKSEQQALIFDGDGSYSLKDRRCSSDPMTSSRDHFQMCR